LQPTAAGAIMSRRGSALTLSWRKDIVLMTTRQALSFIRKHGVVLEAARGPRPSLVEDRW